MRTIERVILLLCLASMGACTPDDSVTVVMQQDIRVFVARQAPQPVRGYEELLVDRVSDVVLFRVNYGAPQCSAGCPYPSAFGLKVRSRIGWIQPPAGTILADHNFDLLASDTYLMDEEFLARVRAADAAAYNAFRLWLAQDQDANHAVLALIAQSLIDDGGKPEHGLALLDHRAVQTNRMILDVLTRAGWMETAWNAVRARAWALLTPMIPGVAQLAFTASTAQRASGSYYGVLTVGNATSSRAWLEFAGLCAPALLLFSQPSYGGEPRWDQSRPPAMACKWVPHQLSIAQQDSGRAVNTSDILGDSLPNGTYFGAVRVRILQPSATTIVIPAGVMTLVR
ncbi:MAG: hypothetical protein ACRENP_26485 [Longimicrobiales bacterium]